MAVRNSKAQKPQQRQASKQSTPEAKVISMDQGQYVEVSTVRVDGRGRLTLAKGRPAIAPAKIADITAYKQYQGEHGEILLVPVVEIPARELWLHQNQEAKESVLRGLKQSARGQTSDMGDFSEYLED
jgi:hypothetical protein